MPIQSPRAPVLPACQQDRLPRGAAPTLLPGAMPAAPPRRLRLALAAVLISASLSVGPVIGQTGGAPTPSEGLEPSRDDLRGAYTARIDEVNQGAGQVLSDDEAAALRLQLEDLQKLLCQRIERVGDHYDCRVEVRIRIADQRPETRVVNLWLEHGPQGWVAR